MIPPAGYLDMLVLMKNAEFILIDSGGIQEEASSPAIRRKVFVMRHSTERPEAVKAGYADVVGVDSRAVLSALRSFTADPIMRFRRCPYGQGHAAEAIVAALRQEL